MECNPGLHSIAKLELNSFYGKFGQCSNMYKTAYIAHYEKLYDFLTDHTKVIKDFHVIDMGMVVMEYIQSEEFQEPNCKQMSSSHQCVAPMHV